MDRNSIADRLARSTSVEQRRYLERCIAAAAMVGQPLYLVGGVIRDLLLTGECHAVDIDLVVEGDAVELAEALADELGGRLTTHSRFLTAEVLVGDIRIDLVTARRERYPEPAGLPVVTPSDLADDLARRDFTVNAMALPLWPDQHRDLVDPWHGEQDLARRWLRVLHQQSFFDDPTRILRGARIGARLDLVFEPETAELAVAAIAADAFEPLSGSRLRQELILLLEEEAVEEALRRLEALGGFLALLGLDPDGTGLDWTVMGQVAGGRSHSWIRQLEPRWWLVVLMAITWRLDRTVRLALADRLEIEGATRALMAEFPERLERVAAVAQSPGVAPHAVCAELETLTREEVTLLVVTQKKDVVGWVRRWLTEWRDLRLVIDGDDLRAAGVAESPQIGRALQATLEARQDGLIEAGEEMEYALGRIRQESG